MLKKLIDVVYDIASVYQSFHHCVCCFICHKVAFDGYSIKLATYSGGNLLVKYTNKIQYTQTHTHVFLVTFQGFKAHILLVI